jgi:hypothetical protein
LLLSTPLSSLDRRTLNSRTLTIDSVEACGVLNPCVEAEEGQRLVGREAGSDVPTVDTAELH